MSGDPWPATDTSLLIGRPAATALPTPCLLLDEAVLRANAARMRGRLATARVSLRPHLKTVKSFDVAALALPTPKGPAAVSTLGEAEQFGRHGVTDLLYAVGLSPQKLERVTALRAAGLDLKVVVDSVAAAKAVAEQSTRTSDPIPTLIELDADGHRSGVARGETDLLLEIGRVLHGEGARLAGVMAHAGDSYNMASATTLAAAAEAERRTAVDMANVLKAGGLPCATVSIGSTPTALSAGSYEGITEIRAGVYLFFDLFQAGVGVCQLADVALSVLATVIGHQPERGWTIVDAGWMAMSADRSTARQATDQYFGMVCDPTGRPYEDFLLLRANQEHGVLAVRPGASARAPALKIGDRVRILPNHACATAAQHDAYQVLGPEGELADVWPRFRGW